MAVKAKVGISGARKVFQPAPPKKTKQGQGLHSRPRGTKKKLRGQGT